ncbi:MAG TPA: nickel-dependent hydrogenase large subunit [Candidatus Sulfomarinibacteraceae bacterium]|nr:nickel-dependent hydrogenase large subunit [Candidatus Sulfomarinibacteraceae bacterium]
MPTITVMDPVTRIEGHLKVEVSIDNNGGGYEITDARCTGTLFRGFETILQGRAPTDAPVLTQRICGVCPVSHGMASVMALEDATGFQVPANARVLRNLVLGANFLQSHILHFYLLSLVDFAQGPQAPPWSPAWEIDLRPDSRLDQMVPHMVLSLEARRRAHEMGAIFGGRVPSPHTFHAGGFTAVPTTERVREFRNQLEYVTTFVERVYVPDAEALAAVYADYRQIGAGHRNLLAYGVFDLDAQGASKLLGPGRVRNGSTTVQPVSPADITERVLNSWYEDATDDLNPSGGATAPVYPKTNGYSWLKAPRYLDEPFEAGPLARMWVNGDYREGISVMDRHLARAYETLKVARAMREWLHELEEGAPVHSNFGEPTDGTGVGLTEAPRGALGHWVRIENRVLGHYQVITPTCWNASPNDGAGYSGPMEQALVGTPVTDPERPVEVLRVIHSFDPCLSCAVHVMRPSGRPTVIRSGLAR